VRSRPGLADVLYVTSVYCHGHGLESERNDAELLRENKRLIDKSIREIDRERNSLQLQERKLIDEMKRNAKNGQMVCIVTQFK
jgi:hypothetical protein